MAPARRLETLWTEPNGIESLGIYDTRRLETIRFETRRNETSQDEANWIDTSRKETIRIETSRNETIRLETNQFESRIETTRWKLNSKPVEYTLLYQTQTNRE